MPTVPRLLTTVAIAAALLGGCDSAAEVSVHPSVDSYPRGQVEIVTDDGSLELEVLLADTAERRQHGLMEVEEMPADVGMLFTGYEEDRTGGFWMKDTLVPLSIAFLTVDGEIVDIIDMEPCTADPCPTYAPDAPYRSALEVRQGWFAERGVAEGDSVRRADGP